MTSVATRSATMRTLRLTPSPRVHDERSEGEDDGDEDEHEAQPEVEEEEGEEDGRENEECRGDDQDGPDGEDEAVAFISAVAACVIEVAGHDRIGGLERRGVLAVRILRDGGDLDVRVAANLERQRTSRGARDL